MIEQQQKMILSSYIDIYELVVPKDNLLRKINELVDFSFIYDELVDKYCLDNGRNAVSPIRMFKYLLLKTIFDLSENFTKKMEDNNIDKKTGIIINESIEFLYES